MSRWKALFVVPVLALACGCAGTTMVPIKALDDNLATYNTVVVSVKSKVAEDVDDQLDDLREETIARISKLKLFDLVTFADGAQANPGHLWIDISITQARKVGGASRFWLGMFAGKASMTTETKFIDAVTGDILGVYKIKGETGSTGSSGTTSQAVEKTADGIVKVIKEKYTPPAAVTTRPGS